LRWGGRARPDSGRRVPHHAGHDARPGAGADPENAPVHPYHDRRRWAQLKEFEARTRESSAVKVVVSMSHNDAGRDFIGSTTCPTGKDRPRPDPGAQYPYRCAQLRDGSRRRRRLSCLEAGIWRRSATASPTPPPKTLPPSVTRLRSVCWSWALEQRLPVFRHLPGNPGAHVFFGGGLIQDIPHSFTVRSPHDGEATHPVDHRRSGASSAWPSTASCT